MAVGTQPYRSLLARVDQFLSNTPVGTLSSREEQDLLEYKY